MNDLFHTVRSLHTKFVVTHRNDDEIVLKVDSAEIAAVIGSANLKFSRPRNPWASRWNFMRNEWESAQELSTPSHGMIREAFIKSVGARIAVSFSDGKEPVVRWGFIADGLIVEGIFDSPSKAND